ncbi:PREDICTED: peroxisome assembly protein 12-like [Priapulus caudatus]|uniref:Peroxisome assembly protein 12 n=1 Tax=Priapulus caudatus TaxID=37621 RepID=A0ABM1DYF0_PRICU|nr:PREDICTED: peroxisome assembly protein 12-like [Priapulus caudatus]XP_014664972.1 PREDICTED: peroxisome assembly protein 12-like [Priapulus caudatus]
MAEHGANISTTSNASNQPSIFEVLAQESLMSAVRPALKHVCKILAEKFPEKFGWLFHFSDEVYLTLDIIVQNYCLAKLSASFAENFYGMKRVPLEKNQLNKLSRRIHLKSLAFLVLIPYIKTKLDKLFERWREENADGRFQDSRGRYVSMVKVYLAAYPYAHMTYEGAMLCYRLAYVFGKSRFHSPLLKLADVELQSLTMEDMMALNVEGSSSLIQPEDSWSDVSRKVCKRLVGTVAVCLSSGLSASVFFLQFMEWWYRSEHSSHDTITALPIPEPPKGVYDVKLLDGVCPVCGQERTNETALSTSGFVFCYPCIHSYIQESGKCPITGFPSSLECLIKLYPSSS